MGIAGLYPLATTQRQPNTTLYPAPPPHLYSPPPAL